MLWYALTALAALLAALRIFQVSGERRDAHRFPAPGRMLGPAGERLHVVVKGAGRGPTVVIEQGAGGFAALWFGVQDAVAEFATVLAYDRRGRGWSAPVAAQQTIDERVEDLRRVLDAAQVPMPYVFVAHSYGGLLVRKFAHAYPERTAGLVLVDTVEEGIHFHPDVLKFYTRINKLFTAIAGLQFFGVPRLWTTLFKSRVERADPRKAALTALSLRPGMFLGMREDMSSLARLPAAERQPWQTGTFGALPITVITHGQPFPGPFAVLEKHWGAGQQRLAALSTDSRLIVAANSNHMIQDDEPQLVIDAIRQAHAAATSSTTRRVPTPASARENVMRT